MNVYDSIMTGLNEAVEYSKGNCKGARVHSIQIEPIPVFQPTDIKEIRKALGMTQGVFASVMGVSTKTVEAWEQGVNAPNGPSCRLLGLFKSNPNSAKGLVREA